MAFQNPDAAALAANPNIKAGDTYTIGGQSYTYQGAPASSPDTINFPEDARKKATDPKYTYQHVSRSGHLFEINDNKGAEHVTLQHRSGSLIQFHPDGKITFTSHNSRYTAIFGTDTLYITGSYDVVVEGAHSMRVEGDVNHTVHGNYNLTVEGDINMLAGKNLNTTALADHEIKAVNQTTKISGKTEHSTEGMAYFGSDGGLGLFSTGGSVNIHADESLVASSGTSTAIAAGTSMSVTAETTLNQESGGAMTITGSTIDLN